MGNHFVTFSWNHMAMCTFYIKVKQPIFNKKNWIPSIFNGLASCSNIPILIFKCISIDTCIQNLHGNKKIRFHTFVCAKISNLKSTSQNKLWVFKNIYNIEKVQYEKALHNYKACNTIPLSLGPRFISLGSLSFILYHYDIGLNHYNMCHSTYVTKV
jgi:hypothetical protein